MSHLSLRTYPEDEFHLQFLEQTLGLDRSQAMRTALSLAVEYVNERQTDKLKILEESEFVGADHSRKIKRIGFKQQLRAKLEKKKHGMDKKK